MSQVQGDRFAPMPEMAADRGKPAAMKSLRHPVTARRLAPSPIAVARARLQTAWTPRARRARKKAQHAPHVASAGNGQGRAARRFAAGRRSSVAGLFMNVPGTV